MRFGKVWVLSPVYRWLAVCGTRECPQRQAYRTLEIHRYVGGVTCVITLQPRLPESYLFHLSVLFGINDVTPLSLKDYKRHLWADTGWGGARLYHIH